MSYILDAIKKSDQQRDLGTTPDVHTIHETPAAEPSRRPVWLYGLAAILLLNAGAIGWWLLWPGTAAKTPVVAQAPEKPAVAQDLSKKSPVTPQQQSVKPGQPPAPAASIPPVPPPQPAQVASPPAPTAVTPPVVQATSAQPPPVSAPPPPSPADESVAANENGAPAGLTVTNPPPPQPAATTAPPAIPASTAPPTTPPETKPAIQPAVVQAQATKPPIVSPPPSNPADKVKTAAVRGRESAAAPKGTNPVPKTSPVAVVPVQTPPPPAASPEEPMAEEETPPSADTDSGTEAAPEETLSTPNEALSPIATTSAPKHKSKKAEKENEDPELAKIPLVNQLPPDIQQTVPEMHISFHSYSINPSARLVSISGKVLREGDAFDDAVKLETITTHGVVMAIKDRRFRVKVNPSARD